MYIILTKSRCPTSHLTCENFSDEKYAELRANLEETQLLKVNSSLFS